MRLRPDDSDCAACFIIGCDCECATCRAAQARNDRLSPIELARLQVATIMRGEPRKHDEPPEPKK